MSFDLKNQEQTRHDQMSLEGRAGEHETRGTAELQQTPHVAYAVPRHACEAGRTGVAHKRVRRLESCLTVLDPAVLLRALVIPRNGLM